MNRREMLEGSFLAAAAAAAGSARRLLAGDEAKPGASPLPAAKFRFGLVTYQWGRDWDLPALIRNCEATGIGGVELRAQHKHGVESNLTADQRKEVRKRFEDSKVTLVGLGCNWQFHETDPKRVQQNMEGAKAYVKLCHDVGGSGVKVKPNGLPKGVPVEKTAEQIGKCLNELGKFAADCNCQIRLEVHGGGTSSLPVIKAIMDVADNKNVGVCWNCNGEDLKGKGLEYNFNLVKDRLGGTAHVRPLEDKGYPYAQLLALFRKAGWPGWMLLEAHSDVKDRMQALKDQVALFNKMTAV